MPFGTVLGVFTIVVLMKDSVKEIFAANNTVVDSLGPGDGQRLRACSDAMAKRLSLCLLMFRVS